VTNPGPSFLKIILRTLLNLGLDILILLFAVKRPHHLWGLF
jgi:hypothetical protein